MVENLSGWDQTKTKENLKAESNMIVVWNKCKRELCGMKYVNAMKTTTKNSLEDFQRQPRSRGIYKNHKKKQYMVYGFIT